MDIFEYCLKIAGGEEGLSSMLGTIEQTQARPRPGDTRTCPDCGRPQHYTGAELGWCHDALVDTWQCADPKHVSLLGRDGA